MKNYDIYNAILYLISCVAYTCRLWIRAMSPVDIQLSSWRPHPAQPRLCPFRPIPASIEVTLESHYPCGEGAARNVATSARLSRGQWWQLG